MDDFEMNFESSNDAAEGGKESGIQSLQERIEKYQEKKDKSSKAMAGIQRTQKDEKKARRDDALLARIIEYFLKDGQYSTIIDAIIPVIDKGFSSNLIIGIISLVFMPATRMIREYFTHPSTHKDLIALAGNERITLHSSQGLFVGEAFDYSLRFAEPQEFDDHNVPIVLRERINLWVEDMGIVITSDPSTILTHRTLELLEGNERSVVVTTMIYVLVFFFKNLNIHITDSKARSYASFILSQLKSRLEGLPLEEV